MITNKEIQACKLSATKKDFYQIWNELLDTAAKLSERWKPASTNESDPGIVLLKVLTGIADKLNYNIDKNILEAYLPSAAQEESMRKLTEMLGYNMKYYQSAKSEATISYTGTDDSIYKDGQFKTTIKIPKYTTITNTDKDINYFTMEDVSFTAGSSIKVLTVPIIEGQRVECESGSLIDLSYINSKNRYFLPENVIAENGIFVYDSSKTTTWEKVDNLNTQPLNKTCFQFGYDSIKSAPYIKFPEDINTLIGDGLYVSYVRTSGVNGNVSSRTLTSIDYTNIENINTSEKSFKETDFAVYNLSAITNGADIETMTEAYNSYKKTIGTFDTLVTCRDYMNKIYELVDSTDNPYCSNIIVSDIRDDINRAVTVVGFNEYGICYENKSKFDESGQIVDEIITNLSDTTGVLEITTGQELTPSAANPGKTWFQTIKKGGTVKYIYSTKQLIKYYSIVKVTVDTSGTAWDDDVVLSEISFTEKIDNFDLVFYPFKTLKGTYTKQNYQSSFKYTDVNLESIKSELEDYKTIAHDIKSLKPSELVCVKNYLKLNARITTNYKVNTTEQSAIRNNIFMKIYEKFNCREVDFGEEIPYDTILETIESADERIKYVILDEPELYTRFLTADGEEYSLVENSAVTTSNFHGNYYNNMLALRNILSGKVEMFRYNEDFEATVQESKAAKSGTEDYELVYPTGTDQIVKLESEFKIEKNTSATGSNFGCTLGDNEQIIFRAPNFRTKITYPCYVNYYFYKKHSSSDTAVAAVFTELKDFTRWDDIASQLTSIGQLGKANIVRGDYDHYIEKYGCIFNFDAPGFSVLEKNDLDPVVSQDAYFINLMTNDGFRVLDIALRSLILAGRTEKYSGLFTRTYNSNNLEGYLVDGSHNKYTNRTSANATINASQYYVQVPSATNDGLGKDANVIGIAKDSEYELKTDDFLYINYTPSSDDDTTQAAISLKYSSGTIIKPNFELKDSKEVRSAGKTFSKQSGFDTTLFKDEEGKPIAGMYSLGTSEQIEIRERVQVTFPKSTTSSSTYYFYFNLNNEVVESDKKTINFFQGTDLAYTLEEGEYFYCTDANKLDMAYYGNGTEIVRSDTTFNISKTNTDDENITAETIVNADNIMEAIPWIKQSFTSTQTLNINEYQYKVLSKGDALIDIQGKTTTTISNTPDSCTGAKFKYSGADSPEELPAIEVSGADWQVRSRLNFNIGPNKIQQLRTIENIDGPSATLLNTITDSISLYNQNGSKIITIADQKLGPSNQLALSLKSNYEVIRESDKVDVSITEYKDSKKIERNDFKLKVFKDNSIDLTENKQIKFSHDIGDYWSKLPSSNIKIDGSSKLYAAFDPTKQFALLAIYFTGKTDNSTEAKLKETCIGLKEVDTSTTPETAVALKIYNYLNGTDTWWTGYKSGDIYYLKEGLNIITVETACTIKRIIKLIKDTDYKNTEANLIISDLRIVDAEDTDGIDIDKLNYRATKQYTPSSILRKSIAEELLADINKVDPQHKFYYSIPIENNNTIEINTYNNENLGQPLKYYDYNNANNKFVVSEIDSEYLSDGIQIVRSSKL